MFVNRKRLRPALSAIGLSLLATGCGGLGMTRTISPLSMLLPSLAEKSEGFPSIERKLTFEAEESLSLPLTDPQFNKLNKHFLTQAQ